MHASPKVEERNKPKVAREMNSAELIHTNTGRRSLTYAGASGYIRQHHTYTISQLYILQLHSEHTCVCVCGGEDVLIRKCTKLVWKPLSTMTLCMHHWKELGLCAKGVPLYSLLAVKYHEPHRSPASHVMPWEKEVLVGQLVPPVYSGFLAGNCKWNSS